MLTLTNEELADLTGYRQPTKQLEWLLAHGYWRACRNITGRVIVARAHHEAVCHGIDQKPAVQRPRVRVPA